MTPQPWHSDSRLKIRRTAVIAAMSVPRFRVVSGTRLPAHRLHLVSPVPKTCRLLLGAAQRPLQHALSVFGGVSACLSCLCVFPVLFLLLSVVFDVSRMPQMCLVHEKTVCRLFPAAGFSSRSRCLFRHKLCNRCIACFVVWVSGVLCGGLHTCRQCGVVLRPATAAAGRSGGTSGVREGKADCSVPAFVSAVCACCRQRRQRSPKGGVKGVPA